MESSGTLQGDVNRGTSSRLRGACHVGTILQFLGTTAAWQRRTSDSLPTENHFLSIDREPSTRDPTLKFQSSRELFDSKEQRKCFDCSCCADWNNFNDFLKISERAVDTRLKQAELHHRSALLDGRTSERSRSSRVAMALLLSRVIGRRRGDTSSSLD